MNTNTAAIESLRAFAAMDRLAGACRTLAELAQLASFAHMCTAALSGEAWASDRLAPLVAEFHRTAMEPWQAFTHILVTDTAPPDGAIARQLSDV